MKWLVLIPLIIFTSLVRAVEKSLLIQRVEGKVEIDGELNEAFWSNAQVAANFIQNTPVAGANSIRKTVVRMGYDNSALYIGAEMFDERDSMSFTLSQRDDPGNADWFGVVIDPYHAGTIGFAFSVTSAGVQIDELHQVSSIDETWNAVWESEVSIKDDRWVAEIKIPFSALRFPKKELQTWGINFMRTIRRKRESSHWNYYNPQGINLISQLGTLEGINGVESPVRLSLTPYVSGYIENFNGSSGYTLNGGMDLKYGLNEAFTLDLTLVPDFGQVQFDQQVLNLSPFEVQFNENRQFFTEGTELFNKQSLLYSRRVGGVPINYGGVPAQVDSNETIIVNPGQTQLINATKLSGRTKKGTGIGVFNAITKPMEAVIENNETLERRRIETAPATNYNVFVLDQNLKHNSTVTFTNTNVLRNGSTYDANVSALGGDFFTNGQRYNYSVYGALSQRYENAEPQLGYKTSAQIAKTRGNFLWSFTYNESNKTYDQNDLGFQTTNNLRNLSARIDYNIYEPFWRFYRVRTNFITSYARLVDPNEFSSTSVYASIIGTFRNFMTASLWLDGGPTRNHDWFEPRVIGRFYEADRFFGGGGFLSSDYSKPFALDISGGYFMYDEENRFDCALGISPRFRVNDQLMIVLASDLEYNRNNEGVALTQSFQVPFEESNPIFGKRDRLTIINRISADYIFTNRMGLTFALRHYWSKVNYNAFFILNEIGQFDAASYDGMNDAGASLHNTNFNAFTIDMVYRWVFAPGSEMTLVWKNSIFASSGSTNESYFQNVNNLIEFPATNSLSLKILYYIDFWETKKRLFPS